MATSENRRSNVAPPDDDANDALVVEFDVDYVLVDGFVTEFEIDLVLVDGKIDIECRVRRRSASKGC